MDRIKEIVRFYKPIYDKLSKKRKKDLCKIIIEYFINELNILNSKKNIDVDITDGK